MQRCVATASRRFSRTLTPSLVNASRNNALGLNSWRRLAPSSRTLVGHPSPVLRVSATKVAHSEKQEPKDEWTSDPTNIKRGPMGWGALGVVVVAGACIMVYAEHLKEERKQKSKDVKPLKPVGRPALGGPFLLVDPKGKNVKSSDLKGQWLLLYFGFTFCPDICPNELTKLTEAIDILDKDIGPNKVTPVFISIDPERDTPQQVGEYISDWHPRFVALTGSSKQVSEVCKTFRVYHSKSPTGDGADEYLVDHSIIIYLIDDNGDFVDFFGKNKTAPEIAQGVKDYMKCRSR